jgi:hypothetical protein
MTNTRIAVSQWSARDVKVYAGAADSLAAFAGTLII